MPSDPRLARALQVVAAPIEQYRKAVAATLEDIRGLLAAGRSDAEARATRLQRQLGGFAAGRIDATRLSAIIGAGEVLDPASVARLEHASDTLRDLLDRGAALFHVTVPAAWDLHGFVATQLAIIGRAFAAARVASAARSGGESGLDEPSALDHFAFAEWNVAERKLAPPLIVTVRGADLVAGALAPFLDGHATILLLVDGECAPAPLVRLITPNVLVVQALAFDELGTLTSWPAAAVAALMPSSAARFVHDPSAGREAWQRIRLTLPSNAPLSRVGGTSAAQQLDELRQLEQLATAPAQATAPAFATAAIADADPADRLAAWLLQQANLGATVK